jgi:hypothetical protein
MAVSGERIIIGIAFCIRPSISTCNALMEMFGNCIAQGVEVLHHILRQNHSDGITIMQERLQALAAQHRTQRAR